MTNEYLNTFEYGAIRIVSTNTIMKHFDEYIGQDIVNEWNFYQLASGEIVAVENN